MESTLLAKLKVAILNIINVAAYIYSRYLSPFINVFQYVTFFYNKSATTHLCILMKEKDIC